LSADCAFIDGNERREIFFLAVRPDLGLRIDALGRYSRVGTIAGAGAGAGAGQVGRCPLLVPGEQRSLRDRVTQALLLE
jgi:hypothetical protein